VSVKGKVFTISECFGDLGIFSNSMELDSEVPFKAPGDLEGLLLQWERRIWKQKVKRQCFLWLKVDIAIDIVSTNVYREIGYFLNFVDLLVRSTPLLLPHPPALPHPLGNVIMGRLPSPLNDFIFVCIGNKESYLSINIIINLDSSLACTTCPGCRR
jgi:hypothetical protein